MSTTKELDLLAILDQLGDAFNDHDTERIMSFFAEDCVFDLPHGDEPVGRHCSGRAAVAKAIAERFEVISGAHWEHIDAWACDNAAVAVFMLKGIINGKYQEFQGCDLFYFDGDKIAKKDTYWKIVSQ